MIMTQVTAEGERKGISSASAASDRPVAVSEGAEEISNSELQVTKDTRTRDKRELDLPMLAAGRGEQEAEGLVQNYPIQLGLWALNLNRLDLKQTQAVLRAK